METGDTTRRLGRADLHIHTTYSDGLVTPEQLLDAATALGLDVIAVTDHDTVEGCARMAAACPSEDLRDQVRSRVHDPWIVHKARRGVYEPAHTQLSLNVVEATYLPFE